MNLYCLSHVASTDDECLNISWVGAGFFGATPKVIKMFFSFSFFGHLHEEHGVTLCNDLHFSQHHHRHNIGLWATYYYCWCFIMKSLVVYRFCCLSSLLKNFIIWSDHFFLGIFVSFYVCRAINRDLINANLKVMSNIYF